MPDGEGSDLLAAIRFDAAGPVPALAQQHDTGEALMLAWMNRAAIAEAPLVSPEQLYARAP